jgi:hypothetical protein
LSIPVFLETSFMICSISITFLSREYRTT